MFLKAENSVHICKRVYTDTSTHRLINTIFSSFLFSAGIEFGQYFKSIMFSASKVVFYMFYFFQNTGSIMLTGKDKLE